MSSGASPRSSALSTGPLDTRPSIPHSPHSIHEPASLQGAVAPAGVVVSTGWGAFLSYDDDDMFLETTMNLITDQRLAMRAHGYSPLPLNGKAPKLTSWQKRSDASEHEITGWARTRPAETNTGLLTRNNPAFDVDILSSTEVADAAAGVIVEELRARGKVMVRFGRKPKRAILCRTIEPFLG